MKSICVALTFDQNLINSASKICMKHATTYNYLGRLQLMSLKIKHLASGAKPKILTPSFGNGVDQVALPLKHFYWNIYYFTQKKEPQREREREMDDLARRNK